MCMPRNHFTPFHDGMQTEYQVESYQPIGHAAPGLRVRVTPSRAFLTCPCGCGLTHIHEHKRRTIHGGTYQGVPIIYVIDRIRYVCSRCGKTFVEEYGFLGKGRSVTTDTENYIVWQLGSMPFSLIATSIGMSVQTIANRATKYGESELKTMLQGHHRYLSMDEVFIGREDDNKHRIYWVLNDISIPWKANNIILDIGRTKEKVIEHLMSLEHRDEVIAVCIDMWEGYKEAIALTLPKAAIVVDRFHVIKLAEKRMNDVRKQSKCSGKDKADMKKDAELFLKSFYKLDAAELERLERYLKLDPYIEKMYYIVQDLLEFYNIRWYDDALEYLCQWESSVIRSNVKEAVSLYETVCEWLPYIMNYFTYRITNGKTEGKNNLIRQIDRMGFHYGLACMRGCLYAHDRRQEYLKWKRYQKKVEKAKDKAKPRKIKICKAGSQPNNKSAPAA